MNTGREGRERGWCAARLLSSQLHLQVTEACQAGDGPQSRAVGSDAVGLLECLPSSSPPLSCHAASLTFVSSWSSSPKTRQLLSVQAFARGSKVWGAGQGYTCHTIP